MKKRGYTLIELLATVIILAIIALIATPIILNMIDDVRRAANYQTVYGLIDGGKFYYAESTLDDSKKPALENLENIYDQIIVDGRKPEEGVLYVNQKGQVAISVIIDNRCYVKGFVGEVADYNMDDEACILSFEGVDIEDSEPPTIVFEILGGKIGNNDWYIENPSIKINVQDLQSGILNYKWCEGLDCEPNHVETQSGFTKEIFNTKATQLCAVAVDKVGNESDKICSSVVKVDSVKPEFDGIADIVVPLNAKVNLKEGISASDSLSGLNGSFTVIPQSIDTSKSNVFSIKYIAVDNAGNVNEATRKVVVSDTHPTIEFIPEEGALNELNWANRDFYVTVKIRDNSGEGIKDFYLCTATTDTCNPENGSVIVGKTSELRYITQESNNNRICVKVINNMENNIANNQLNEVICSQAFKLDKTNPNAGTISVKGNKGKNGWYTSDVTIDAVDGSDGLSGHLNTSLNVKQISGNTQGTKVVVTTEDNANNISSAEYTVKVDKDMPTIIFDINGTKGKNDWYVSETTIKASVADADSGIASLRWCQGIDCKPDQIINDLTKEISFNNTLGTQLCVQAIDNAGNETLKECSSIVKVDTIAPEFSGISDIIVSRNVEIDLTKDIFVNDKISGLAGSYTYSPDYIDSTVENVVEVLYTAEDKAGNRQEITRKVVVSDTHPTIEFIPEEGAINELGWANKDFSVMVNIIDNSGKGIKEFKMCTSTTDTCDPETGSVTVGKTSELRDITQEGNNRICVKVINNDDQSSEVICSEAFKLDKTEPTVGLIKVDGKLGNNGWYVSDVKLSKIDGSDNLSGHLETTISLDSITGNTKGKEVTVTTKDNAYNEDSLKYTIKIDKSKPNCSFEKSNYVGLNKMSEIVLTCTNEVSGMDDIYLTAEDFTSSNIKILSVNRESITNGYKYVISLEGQKAGKATINLPTNKIKTVAGLSNEVLSTSITVTSIVLNPTNGIIYLDGKPTTSTIISNGAGILSCESSDETKAMCSISGNVLSISPKTSIGEAVITVNGTNGNVSATYTAVVKEVSLELDPSSGKSCSISTELIYTCPEGYSKSSVGGEVVCEKEVVTAAILGTPGICPSGYIDVGNGTCEKTLTSVAILEEVGYCPQGYRKCSNWDASEDHHHCVASVEPMCESGYVVTSENQCVVESVQSCTGPYSNQCIEDIIEENPLKDKVCPSGYDMFNGNIYEDDDWLKGLCFDYVSSKSQTQYMCPTGYELNETANGLTCLEIEEVSPISTIKYSCPYGYSECNKWGVNDHHHCYDFIEPSECPEGYSLNAAGTMCLHYTVSECVGSDSEYCIADKSVEKICPTGYTKYTGTEIDEGNTNIGKCYKEASPSQKIVYSCPEGYYRLSGSGSGNNMICAKTTNSVNPIANTAYTCEDGYEKLDGEVGCTKTVIIDKPEGTSTSCPEGYDLVGEGDNATCKKVVKTDPIVETPSCPEGTSNVLKSNIKGDGYGKLTCESSDVSKATCSISGNVLTINANTEAKVTITVTESNANKTATYTINDIDKKFGIGVTITNGTVPDNLLGTTKSLNCNGVTGVYNDKYNRLEFTALSSKNATCILEYNNYTGIKTYLTDYVDNEGVSGDGSIINDNGYRYIGKNPNNYVWFNNEMWRIIGSFDTAETGTSNGNYNVKIIRDEVLGGYVWSSASKNVWYGTSESTASDLYKILNINYYNATDGTNSGYCYGYSTTSKADCNFTETGIQSEYRNMIMNAKWRMGGYSSNSVTASAMYGYEGTTSYSKATRPLISPGYIGIMNASDYGYASSSCYKSTKLSSMGTLTCTGSNWLYGKGDEWTLSQLSSNSDGAFYVGISGSGSLKVSGTKYGHSTRPVLYLESNVYVVSGDGSEANPYILGM